jgi:hypothetical protein
MSPQRQAGLPSRPTFLVRVRVPRDHVQVTGRAGKRPPVQVRGRLTALAAVVAIGALDVLVRVAVGHGGGGTHETAADLPAVAPVVLTTPTPTPSPSARPRPRTQVHVVTSPAGHDVHGIVVDAAGHRVAGVHVGYDESLPDAPGFRPMGVTDAAGRFAVPCESRSIAPTAPALIFSSYDAATGIVDPRAPNVAWVEIAQQCASSASIGVRVTVSSGAALTGTLYEHGAPVHAAGWRVGVECDGMPRGNVNAFYAQVSAVVDARTGTFRLAGLRTDRCAVGVFDRPAGAGREIVLQVDVTAGRTTHLDVHDDGQDHFPGRSGGGPSASPTPTPSSSCLAVCPRTEVRDRP